MNRLTIIGNLTADPVTRTTQSGLNVCTFTVAVNRRKTQNNPDPGADFFRVTAWRQLGENCQKYLAKGRKVAVIGAVSLNTFQKNDGTSGASLELTADDIEFLTPKAEQTASAPAAQTAAPDMGGYEEVTDDDLPFD